jgi:uncharacterized membrane protein YkoI
MSATRKLVILVSVLALGLGGLAVGIAAGAGDDGFQARAPVSQQDDDGDGGETGQSDDADGSPTSDDSRDDDADGSEAEETDDADEALTGVAAQKAADAGVEVAGGGTAVAVESDDDGAGYEVEVRKDDGGEAEVELDRSFNVRDGAEDDD